MNQTFIIVFHVNFQGCRCGSHETQEFQIRVMFFSDEILYLQTSEGAQLNKKPTQLSLHPIVVPPDLKPAPDPNP